jgi:hypothetical protein
LFSPLRAKVLLVLLDAKYLAATRVRILVEGNAAAIKGQLDGLGLGAPDLILSKQR